MSVYSQFAECAVLGWDKSHLTEFMEYLHHAVDEHAVVVMADRHLVACPNFRRAFRSDVYTQLLQQWIEEEKIQAAMMDGFWTDDGIRHFTFNQFQQWFTQCHLWPEELEDIYKDNASTKKEFDFFDMTCRKILTQSPDFDTKLSKNGN